MNARQKCKKLKKELKELKVPVNTVYIDSTGLQHFKFKYTETEYDRNIALLDPSGYKEQMTRNLMNEIAPIIIDYVVANQGLFDETNYTLDIWMRR